ncbi:hypothetical protein SXM_2318 [Shewanella xiamenensis]|nr:hypothetical protein SXM_2318 [Shewanella xiamenensis]
MQTTKNWEFTLAWGNEKGIIGALGTARSFGAQNTSIWVVSSVGRAVGF